MDRAVHHRGAAGLRDREEVRLRIRLARLCADRRLLASLRYGGPGGMVYHPMAGALRGRPLLRCHLVANRREHEQVGLDRPRKEVGARTAKIRAQQGDTPMRLTRRLLASCLFCATVLSAGCALRSRSIVGTWDIQGGPGPATMTFQSDGNCRTEAHLPGRSSMVFGPYKQQGDQVTFDMSVNSHRTATIQ